MPTYVDSAGLLKDAIGMKIVADASSGAVGAAIVSESTYTDSAGVLRDALGVFVVSGNAGASLTISPTMIPLATTANVSQATAGLTGTITYSKVSGSSNVAINSSTGYITLTAALTAGATNTFTLRAANGAGDAVEKTFTITGQVTLAALAVSSSTFDVNAIAGATLAAISNTTAGSTLSISPNDGRLAISGTNIVRGLSAWSAGPLSYTIIETFAGAVGSPKSNAFTATIATNSGVGDLMSSRTVQAGFAAMNGSNGTTDIDSNTRSSHWNESGAAVNKLKLIYPGWWYSSNVSPAEQNAPNNFNITCAIEYPAGTFTPVTIGAIVAGTNTVSSEVTLSTPIPANTQFWVRTYAAVTSGQKWMVGYQMNANLGEASDRNTATDKTTSGTITGTSTGCGPIAIVATNYSSGTPVSTRWAGFGDSSVEGATVSIQDIHGNQGFVGHACTSNVPYMNIARGGATAVATVSAMAKRLEIMTMVRITDAVVGQGSNDVIGNTGIAASTVTTALQTIFSAITAAGIRVHANPLPPNVTTSLTSIYGVPGTTTASGWAAGSSSTRALINQFIRTPNASIYRFNDTSALVETSLDSGLFKTSADFTGGSANVRIPPPRPITIQSGSTTTSFNTNLVVGSGITTNSLSAKLAAVYFTSGALTGIGRVISTNTLYGAVINTALATSTPPSAGDTAIIYEISLTPDGAHTTDLGHNSVLPSAYYGASWLWSDMLAQYIAGRNATT